MSADLLIIEADSQMRMITSLVEVSVYETRD
jgi:hypothetical protein